MKITFKRIVGTIVIGGYLIALAAHLHAGPSKAEKINRASDAFARKHSVMLISDTSQCSGIEVQAPSGKIYLLTASHCRLLGKMKAIREDGTSYATKIISISSEADIMLMTTPATEGLLIADSVAMYEKVHTMTHGMGARNHRTDGELLEDFKSKAPEFVIESEEDEKRCLINKLRSIELMQRSPMMEMFTVTPICVMTVTNVRSTAKIVGGSSGGAVMNADGAIVGIVSASDGYFSYFAKLSHIKKFLAKR